MQNLGALAQLGERLICIQEVIGSIPIGSTTLCLQANTTSGTPAEDRNDLREASAPGPTEAPSAFTRDERIIKAARARL